MEPLKRPRPEEDRRHFLDWVRGNTGKWMRAWIRLIYKHIPSYGIVPRRELEQHIARHFECLLAYWEDGSEDPLSDFYLELSKKRIRQEIGISDVVQAVILGRSLLLQSAERIIPYVRLILGTFDKYLVRLISSYERAAEETALEAEIRLAETERISRHFQAEWGLLDQILSEIEAGIVLINSRMRVAWINKGMPRDLLLAPHEEVIGKPCREILVPEILSCENCPRMHGEQLDSTLQHIKEVTLRGKVRDFLKITRPIVIGRDREAHVLDIYLDITVQQEAQRALARTQELVQNILNSSVSAIFSFDLEGRVTLVNQAAQRLLGAGEGDLLGICMEDLVFGGKDETGRIRETLLAREYLLDDEIFLVAERAHPIPVRMSASLLRDEKGELIGTMCFCQDISTERALRREVVQREKRLLAILQGSLDGLVVLDPDHRVVLWNRGASLLLGAEEGEVIGRPIQDFLRPEWIQDVPLLEPSDRSTVHFEARIPQASGRILNVLGTRTDMPTSGGDPGGASLVLKDVTELKRLEKELVQAEHLADLGRLSASVAHEIKNPIAGLLGAMAIISEELGPDDPRHEIAREAHAQVKRLDSLVKDLLAYAKPFNLKAEAVPVALLVEATIPMVRDALGESHIKLATDIPPDLPAVVADPQQIHQVLFNLMQNGIQAMESGGLLTISAEQSEDHVAIHISDTGPGISEADLARIFQPFFTTKHIGTGLGLSIVRRILNAHHGRCEVSSRQGEGSTFSIFLPAAIGECDGE